MHYSYIVKGNELYFPCPEHRELLHMKDSDIGEVFIIAQHDVSYANRSR